MSTQRPLAFIDHPELRQKALPAGVNVNAVVRRKRALIEGATDADRAEQMAIEAEISQADHNAKAGIVASEEKSSFLVSDSADTDAGGAADTAS